VPSPQLVYVVYLMWYDVSTSKCHLQAGGIKYLKEMKAIINMFTIWQPSSVFLPSNDFIADPSGRAVYGVGLRPLACWDCGFESHWRHGCLSFVSVVSCQAEVSASGWSLIQRSPTECGVSECDHESSIMRRPWSNGGCRAMVKKNHFINIWARLRP